MELIWYCFERIHVMETYLILLKKKKIVSHITKEWIFFMVSQIATRFFEMLCGTSLIFLKSQLQYSTDIDKHKENILTWDFWNVRWNFPNIPQKSVAVFWMISRSVKKTDYHCQMSGQDKSLDLYTSSENS